MKNSVSWLILTVASVCICLAPASKASTYSLPNKDLLAQQSDRSNQPILVSDEQVRALAEAIRLATPQITVYYDRERTKPIPRYSQWKLTPRAIATQSKICTGQVVSPEQFEANPDRARSIIECFVRILFNQQYSASDYYESEAVRRTAAMWMDSLPDYNSSPQTAEFSRKVLNFYQQLRYI